MKVFFNIQIARRTSCESSGVSHIVCPRGRKRTHSRTHITDTTSQKQDWKANGKSYWKGAEGCFSVTVLFSEEEKKGIQPATRAQSLAPVLRLFFTRTSLVKGMKNDKSNIYWRSVPRLSSSFFFLIRNWVQPFSAIFPERPSIWCPWATTQCQVFKDIH